MDHSIYRLTEPDVDEPFVDVAASVDGRFVKVHPARRSIWTCWVDCPADEAGTACEEQEALFERGYDLVSEHAQDRPDVGDVERVRAFVVDHPTFRYVLFGERIDELHAYFEDVSRQRVLVVVGSWPQGRVDGMAELERVLTSIRITDGSATELRRRWGGLAE